MTRSLIAVVFLLAVTAAAFAQDRTSKDEGWTPKRVGIGEGTERSSQPFVPRRYKADPDDPDKPAKLQPKNFVKTVPDGYKLGEGEVIRVHEGVDLACSEPKEFKAGIYGKVFRSGGGDFNTITVKLIDGTIVQYLHSSAVYVREGDIVGPDTVLGITGKTGASAVHLHIQARDLKGPIHPDKALALGLKKPVTTIYPPDLKWVDFDIEAASVKTPNVKVVDGTVRITFDDNAPKGFEGVWATDRNGFVLRVEKGGKFYVVNPSSGGSISAGKWSEDKNTLQGSTESVFSTDTWSTTYGEVHDVEMSIVGAKLVGKWRSNYLTESGKEVGKYSEGKFTKCPEFLRKQSIDFKDYWWMDKHK